MNNEKPDLPAQIEIEIAAAIEALTSGADVRETIATLIARHDGGLREAIIQRLREKIEARRVELERERAARAGRIIAGGVFDPAGAVLLMATGTYEAIERVFQAAPNLRARVTGYGVQLLDAGVEPDMKMLARLREIYNRAIAAQRASSEGAPDANPRA